MNINVANTFYLAPNNFGVFRFEFVRKPLSQLADLQDAHIAGIAAVYIRNIRINGIAEPVQCKFYVIAIADYLLNYNPIDIMLFLHKATPPHFLFPKEIFCL